MGTIKEAREIFANDRYATVLSGAFIEEIGENYAKCSMKITADHRNAYGGIMGGSIYTLADFAFAVASNFDIRFRMGCRARMDGFPLHLYRAGNLHRPHLSPPSHRS